MSTHTELRLLRGGQCVSDDRIRSLLESIERKIITSRDLLASVDDPSPVSLRALDWALINVLEAVGEADAALDVVRAGEIAEGFSRAADSPPSPRAILRRSHQGGRSAPVLPIRRSVARPVSSERLPSDHRAFRGGES